MSGNTAATQGDRSFGGAAPGSPAEDRGQRHVWRGKRNNPLRLISRSAINPIDRRTSPLTSGTEPSITRDGTHRRSGDVVRHTRPAPKALTEQEQLLLLRETGRTTDDFRDHVIVATALGSGLRVGELVALDVGDIRNGKGVKGIITLRPETTKGNRGGEIALPERLRRKLVRYLRWKAERGESLDPGAPLFCSRGGGRSRSPRGSRLSKRATQTMFRRWQKRIGFDRTCTMHQLRHSYCQSLWKATGDIRLVQQAARHASPTTTAIYAVPTIQDLVEAVQDLPC